MISSEHDATPDDGADRVSVAAEFVPPFRLHLLNDDGQEVDRDGVIEGIVTNTSLASWTVNHRVGLRDFRDVHGRGIRDFELRATLFPSCIEPGEKAWFRFELAALMLPRDAAMFTLDVVEDGSCWLQEKGSTPLEFTVRGLGDGTEALWTALLREEQANAEPVLAQRLELLEAAIRAPAVGRPTIRRLSKLMDDCAAGRPYRPVRPDSATIARSLRDDGAGDPNDKFIRHFAISNHQTVDGRNPESLASVFADFAVHSAASFRTGGIPLPKNLTTWLGRRALPRAIATSPVSRSMVATLDADSPIVLNPRGDGQGPIWDFANSVMVGRNLACSAMPDSALHIVTRPARNTPRESGFPAATHFMWRANEGREDGQFKLDLVRDADRLSLAVAMFLEGLENEAQRCFLGSEVRDWLDHPLGERNDALSAIEVMILALCGRKPPPGLLPNDDVRVLRRQIGWLSLSRTPTVTNDIRIIGLYSSPSGLGTNMRMSEQVLHSLGCTLELVDTEVDQAYPAAAAAEPLFALSRPVDLFHLNLDDVPALVCRYARADRLNVYRIGFALWETSAMPEEHRIGLELVDEIWAPTEFVAEVYRSAGHPNVHVIGKGIQLPQPRPFDLGRLGIREGTFVFLAAFDLGSWIERKDPVAAVEAFKRAFPQDHTVRLVVKSNGLFDHSGDKTNQVARLQAVADDDERIILFSEMLPFPEYLGLIQAADATVSPHRAEGFGYLPAYSLLLGTPVIATDFSGTQDFCTEETSFPVRAQVVRLRPGEFFYDAPDATWANIDVDHLAERMQEVRNDPDEAARRTHRGGDLINERYSMRAMGARYRERLAALQEV